MTTKQGLSFVKDKGISDSIIEGNTQRAEPLKDIDKKAPVLYSSVVKKNTENANEAFRKCKNFCDERYSDEERQACYLGCNIKNQSNSPGNISLSKNINFSVPYDKWKKEYNKTLPKSSNNKIKDSYKKWSPPHKYGDIPTYKKRVCSNYKCWKRRRKCFRLFWGGRACVPYYWYGYCGKRCKNVQQYKRGIIKQGKQVTVPAKWEKCNWTETYRFPDELEGKNVENHKVNNCTMFKTNSREDVDDEYYKDYSSYKLTEACNYGMKSYTRKDCSVVNNKIVCDGTKNGRYLNDDMMKSTQEEKLRKQFLFKQDDAVEGFSNNCKEVCGDYNSIDDITNKMTDGSDSCYKCEVKYNPLIRYENAKEEYIDNIIYRASPEFPLENKLNELNSKYHPKRDMLIDYNGKADGTIYNKESKQIQQNVLNKNKALYDLINNMPYSKKNNATINAFLEDMNSKVPSKNIEYGIWAGLAVAAGVTVAALINKD
jgi:hypothetical protein